MRYTQDISCCVDKPSSQTFADNLGGKSLGREGPRGGGGGVNKEMGKRGKV